jgi:glycosyltransferase involved in cell wall biosynthesis
VNPAVAGPASTALAQRISTVQDVLRVSPSPTPAGGAPIFESLKQLVEVVGDKREPALAWLLVVGLTGAMPNQALVRSVTRTLSLEEPDDSVTWLLDAVVPLATSHGSAGATLRVVRDRALVDVTLTAKSEFLTGIQRVVRGVASEWNDRHDIELVVWDRRGGAYRALHATERGRLLEREARRYDATAGSGAVTADEVVVPWRVPVILTEVPLSSQSDRLAAVAELTPSSVRLIGYDCIPVSSAETVTLAEPEKFGRYLELAKHADRIAGISRSAAAEFEGFRRSLGAQGLSGPTVVACPLPHTTTVGGDVAESHGDDSHRTERPLVLSIGSVGRRKNQAALVVAAEMLWREGLDFELRILGHMGTERSPLVGLIPELQSLGRPVVHEPGVSDRRMAESLMQARCLVFPTLHEGFGLPVAEALSHGVPVITSDFGSMRELADGNGGLLVDPEDFAALADALRAMLVDEGLHARLVAEAAARPNRTWVDYADDLWETLLG